MSEKYEVVIAGGGHCGLTAACYLAKAGVNVGIFERHPYVGGGSATTEIIAPGFKTDMCSLIHVLIQGNPLIAQDELGLQSKYGLEYIRPDLQMLVHFQDGTYFPLYKSVDKMADVIAQYSPKDAESYLQFNSWAEQSLEMLLAGLYNPPPPFGPFMAMLDQSEQGRDLIRAMMVSSLDIISDWFEHEKVKMAFTRWVTEIMICPHTKGTGMVFFLMMPLMHKYGAGMPVGGAGALSESMVRFLEDHGATIRTSSHIKEFKIEGNECKGIVLEDGEEILATKAVLSNFNIKQMIPDMVPGATLPEGFETKVERLQFSEFQCFHQGLAMHEAPKYKIGSIADEAFLVEFAPNTVDEYLQYFDNIKRGIPGHNPLVSVQTLHDPTRAPEGKHTAYFYEYAPYNLKDGGPAKWDEIREQYADEVMEFFQQYTTNMSSENLIGRWMESPLDLERYNPSMLWGDFGHLGSYVEQNMGNRPLPGWNYRLPIDNLYMTGPGTHPGSGVSGGGRAAVQVLMEDMDIDFEDTVAK